MTTFLLGVVGVFRKCRACEQWKTLGAFNQGRIKTCSQCIKRKTLRVGGPTYKTTIRTLRITEAGREQLRREGL